MMSKDPLKQFAADEEVSKSVETTVQWDEVFDPIFNFRVSMVNEKIASPFIAGAPFPNPHTLFITADKDNVEMKRLIGHGKHFYDHKEVKFLTLNYHVTSATTYFPFHCLSVIFLFVASGQLSEGC